MGYAVSPHTSLKEIDYYLKDKLGICLVTCGDCEELFHYPIEEEVIACPRCKTIGEPCDYPDAIY